jgi:hypothetical protein
MRVLKSRTMNVVTRVLIGIAIAGMTIWGVGALYYSLMVSAPLRPTLAVLFAFCEDVMIAAYREGSRATSGNEGERAGSQNKSIRPEAISCQGITSIPGDKRRLSRAVVTTQPRCRPRSFMHCRNPATA